MIVTKSHHNKVVSALQARIQELEGMNRSLRNRENTLTREHNDVARKFNTLRALVDSGSLTKTEFTPKEIETLVRLCHPDKHNGSASANTMTAKLLTLRTKK